MVNYKEGKIYKIISNHTTDIYIGSTVSTLTKRLSRHKHGGSSSSEIIKYGDAKIILIEKYPCNDKDELRMREQYHIDNNKCINKVRSHRTDKYTTEYKQKYRDENKDYMKEWRENNKDYTNKYINQLKKYQKSWGGDYRFHNNLLKIDIDLFQN